MSLDQLMRRPAVTQPPTASCYDAAELMRDRNVGSIVVVQDGSPQGIVTDRDLVTRIIASKRDAASVPLREVMSPSPIFLYQRRSLWEAIDTMRELGVRRLPVVDNDNRLAGIVSLDDILVHLSRQLAAVGQTVERELWPLE
jgi:CBS domain-containing protein